MAFFFFLLNRYLKAGLCTEKGQRTCVYLYHWCCRDTSVYTVTLWRLFSWRQNRVPILRLLNLSAVKKINISSKSKSRADLYCIHLPVLYLYSGVQETQTRSRQNREHIHPSTFWHLSRVGGQQSIHSSPDLLFPSFLLQAFQSHVLGLPQGLPLVGYAQNTSLRRCPAGILVIYLNSLTPPSPIPSLRESRAAFQGKHHNLIHRVWLK